MKKTGLLLLLCLATVVAAAAQQTDSASAEQPGAQGTVMTMGTYPVERIQAPTAADLYCGGFVSKDLVPNANFVSGGLESPNTTKFARNDTIFLAGTGLVRMGTRRCVSSFGTHRTYRPHWRSIISHCDP